MSLMATELQAEQLLANSLHHYKQQAKIQHCHTW
jgi:hypothetical protein